jgi:hypothetical protein
LLNKLISFSPNRKESAPDSSSLRTPVDQPSPESCSQPAYGVTRPVGIAPTGHCGHAQVPLGLTVAILMLDIGTEWTPSRLSPKSNALSASSRCRTLDRWARAILRLRIEGTTKCSRKVHGFAFGSGMASAAEASPRQSGSGKSKARVPPEFEYSKFSLNHSNGDGRFMSAHTNQSASTTGAAVPGGRWRIDWPRTKSRDMTR